MEFIINKDKEYTIKIITLMFMPESSQLVAHVVFDGYDNKIPLDIDATELFTQTKLDSIVKELEEKISKII